ncbi:DNA photolyase family protein [Chryseobacterium suipulveris]|uniref:DNA photolyase family protein n=1 Tax=Chryseobacterium suipulveris TaxID=2929800 RepID=A0ABY4BS32_9FLAO|nr:deoxyribodipyrimidine photo-lyase [Chryseobacterium suipulveris]UOE41579.1 DNA photolyase family protein [Chryseobacterium suipulveris]
MKINIFWFRRDLRLDDNHGLYQALSQDLKVVPIFIFDQQILTQLSDKKDKRVQFIYEAIERLNKKLAKVGSGVDLYYGNPKEVFEKIIKKYDVHSVFTNEDYEPYALRRDGEIHEFLQSKNIEFKTFKDQVIFAPQEVLKIDGQPFQVYSPYAKQWESQLPENLEEYKSEDLLDHFFQFTPNHLTLKDIGFENSGEIFQKPSLSEDVLKQYGEKRNFPAADATSKVSVHLRFGTVGIRKLVNYAKKNSNKFLRELIWREFFMMLLYHFPHTVTKSFKPKYDDVKWEFDEDKFKKWCEGKTGFPLVDAGMRELNETGFMHNRVRMLVASFLIKDLHIDWKIGEAYFANKLLDYDQAQNIGNWQWVAGSGADGSPYFRVFNPYLQQEKFDKNFTYIKKWIPEYGTAEYPKEMVNHDEERKKAIEYYKDALNSD